MKPNLTFKRWPGAVGYVPQTTVVTSGTIIQNITLGYDSKEVNLPRIKKCLELSGLHEFTNESKMGLYLDVGDSGHKLTKTTHWNSQSLVYKSQVIGDGRID